MKISVITPRKFENKGRSLEIGKEKTIPENEIKSKSEGKYYLEEHSTTGINRKGILVVHHEKFGITVDIHSFIIKPSQQPSGTPISREEAACLYRIRNRAKLHLMLDQLKNSLKKNDSVYIDRNERKDIKKAKLLGVHDGWIIVDLMGERWLTIDDVISPQDLFHVHSCKGGWESTDHKLDDIFSFTDKNAYRETRQFLDINFGCLVCIVVTPRTNETWFILRCLQKSDRMNSEVGEDILKKLYEDKRITDPVNYKVFKENDIQKCESFCIEMKGRNLGRIMCCYTNSIFLDVERRENIDELNGRYENITGEWVPYLLAIQDKRDRVKVIHNQQMEILDQKLPVRVMFQSGDDEVDDDRLKDFRDGLLVLQTHGPVTVDKVFYEKNTPSWIRSIFDNPDSGNKVRIKNIKQNGIRRGYLKVPWEDLELALIEFDDSETRYGRSQTIPRDLKPFAEYFEEKFSKPFGFYNRNDFEDVPDMPCDDGSNPYEPIPTKTSENMSRIKWEEGQSMYVSSSNRLGTEAHHKSLGTSSGAMKSHNKPAYDSQLSEDSFHTLSTGQSPEANSLSSGPGDSFGQQAIVPSSAPDESMINPSRRGDQTDSLRTRKVEQKKDTVKTSMIQKLEPYLRMRVMLSCQLENTKLQKDYRVLVPAKYDSNRYLALDTIEKVTGNKIEMSSGREFTIDQVFDFDYLDRNFLWMDNLLEGEADSFQSGELIYYKKEKGGIGMGHLTWCGKIPWEEARSWLIVESLTKSVDKTDDGAEGGENDSQFINYRKVVDKGSTIIKEDDYIDGAKVVVLVSDAVDKNMKDHESGSLWVTDDTAYYRVDDDGEMEGGSFVPVRDELVKLLINVEANKRLRLLLSQQLEKSSLEVGEKIRIAAGDDLVRCRVNMIDLVNGHYLVNAIECDDDKEFSKFHDEDKDDCGPDSDVQDDEAKCEDAFFPKGQDSQNHEKMSDDYRMRNAMFDGKNPKRRTFKVPLHKVYDDDYMKRRNMDWTKDLLEKNGCEYKRDQMIYFKTENPTRYTGGVLKQILKTPWNDQVLFVIERCTDDDEFEGILQPDLVNFSFIYFDSQNQQRAIVTEDQIWKESRLVISKSSNQKKGDNHRKGTLWIHKDKDLFAFDGEVQLSEQKMEFEEIPDYYAHLIFAVDEDKRNRVVGLHQLGQTKLSSGDTVLVTPDGSENPKDLKEGIVQSVQYGMVSIKMKNSCDKFSADRIYHNYFLKDLQLKGKDENGDVVFWDPKEQRYRLGSLKWSSSLDWEGDYMFVIECFSDWNDDLIVEKESKPIYFQFKHIADARNQHRCVDEDKIYVMKEAVQIYLLIGRSTEDSKRKIHCELRSRLGYKESKEIEEKISTITLKTEPLEIPRHSAIDYTKLRSVPHEFVRYLARIPQNILRLRFLESKQFDKNNLRVKQSVLIDRGTRSLEDTRITRLEDGLIVVEGGQVTIDKIFDAAYPEYKPNWTENLLETQTPQTYKMDELVTFSQGNEIRFGFLKWKGSVPWLESHLMGIECIKKNIDDDPLERCSGRMVHFIPVMDTDEDYSVIVEDNEVKKAEIFILKVRNKDFGIGTLWSKQDLKYYNIEEEGEIDADDLMKDDVFEIPPHLLPFVLVITDVKERRKVMLSGQLKGFQLQHGEEVFVVKDPGKVTGNPTDLLERTKITKVTNKDIEVEKFGKVEIGQIFVPSYFSDAHSWTDNYLGKPGYLQVSHDKYVEWKGKEGEIMSGAVKWFGKVPWEDEMLVGISTTKEIQRDEDFDGRYLHFLQLMHSDKRQSIIIPEKLIDDNFLADPSQSPFAEVLRDDFPIGCYVSLVDGKPETWYTGTVKWTGEYICTLNTPLAVVVLNKKHDKGTNGRFMGIPLVSCSPNRALLLSSKLLYRVPDLEIGDIVEFLPPAQGPKCTAVVKWLEPNPKRKWLQQIGIQLNKRFKKTVNVKDKFDCPDGYGLIVAVYKLAKTKAEESVIENPVPPISCKTYKELFGENKGIQGYHNSCYLDTILFSMFTFTSEFEDRIPKGDPDVEEARNLVLNGIVYPLRKNMYVPFTSITSLRQLLADMSDNDAYLSETRDIPECLEILFGKVLEINPWIRTVANNMNMTSYHTEIFPFPDAKGVATSQLYLEFSAMFMDFRFTEKPSTLILQLQREGSHSPKPMVPSLFLDLTICMANYVPNFCSSCGEKHPKFRVDSRFDMNGLKSTFVCVDCAAPYPQRIPLSASSNTSISATGTDNLMKLTAVICIERSHYNCFVRCGNDQQDDWIFFDSMADQTHTGENIPKIIPVNLTKWIKEALTKREISPRSYFSDKRISERPFVHPYALIYQS